MIDFNAYERFIWKMTRINAEILKLQHFLYRLICSGGARHVIYAYTPTLSDIYLSFLKVEFAAFYILPFSITCPQKF